MDRGAWKAIFRGSQRIGHDWSNLFAPKMCSYGKNAKFRVRDLGLSSRSHIHDLRYYFNSCTEFHPSSLLKNRVSINHIKGSTGRLNKITCRAPSIYVVHVRHLVSK